MYDFIEKCRATLDIPAHIEINLELLSIVDEEGNVLGEGYVAQNDSESYDMVLHDGLIEQIDIEETIKHEMKHIQQMVQGRLLIDKINNEIEWGVWWEGIFYKENESYYNCPWEVEAREFEKQKI